MTAPLLVIDQEAGLDLSDREGEVVVGAEAVGENHG